jgi:hypothetical protein
MMVVTACAVAAASRWKASRSRLMSTPAPTVPANQRRIVEFMAEFSFEAADLPRHLISKVYRLAFSRRYRSAAQRRRFSLVGRIWRIVFVTSGVHSRVPGVWTPRSGVGASRPVPHPSCPRQVRSRRSRCLPRRLVDWSVADRAGGRQRSLHQTQADRAGQERRWPASPSPVGRPAPARCWPASPNRAPVGRPGPARCWPARPSPVPVDRLAPAECSTADPSRAFRPRPERARWRQRPIGHRRRAVRTAAPLSWERSETNASRRASCREPSNWSTHPGRDRHTRRQPLPVVRWPVQSGPPLVSSAVTRRRRQYCSTHGQASRTRFAVCSHPPERQPTWT